jgi:two-component system chemotaxis response regulator CheY
MNDNLGKVLVVEDSPTMQQLYKLVLGGGDGTELIFAADGAEGLDRAAQEPDLDLMVVDINMPRIDGLEFLRRARSELGITAPAIVISTEGEQSDRDAAELAGGDAYLRKPWTPDQLMAAIRAVPRAGVE